MSEKVDLSMKLSENFTLNEFIFSETAERFGIDNTPASLVIQNLKKLCETILEPARHDLGPIRINSGYRSYQLNKQVGGSTLSAHMYGFAADVVPLKVSKIELVKWLVKNVKYDQIILEFGTKEAPAWIHVSSDPRHRMQLLRILKGTGYVPIKVEDL